MSKAQQKKRNWALVVIASVVIVLNVVALAFVLFNLTTFGGWSLVIIAGTVLSIVLSVMAIRKNEPAWLLLDLILPN